MNRIYEKLLTDHFTAIRQMAFLSSPRQSGKTTLAKMELPDARCFSYQSKGRFRINCLCRLIKLNKNHVKLD